MEEEEEVVAQKFKLELLLEAVLYVGALPNVGTSFSHRMKRDSLGFAELRASSLYRGIDSKIACKNFIISNGIYDTERERNFEKKSSQFKRLSVDNTDDEGNEIKGQVVSIDTGSPVNSAGFGSGTPESQLAHPLPQRQYWTRFDFTSQQMVFATGHVNGRIRIWDDDTGRKLLELMDHQEAVRDLAFAPDGSLRLVSASLDHTIKVFSFNILIS